MFLDEVTNDERKENIIRLFLLSSKKEEVALPEKKLNDLQYIYTISKKIQKKREKNNRGE